MGDWIERPLNDFHGRALPEPGIPTGYAALIERYDLRVPLPPRLAAISERHHPISDGTWRMLTPRHQPAFSLGAQLVFAFRYEGIDLQVLAALFEVVPPETFEAIILATPTGSFARRLWFLYEWRTGQRLNIADPGPVRAIPVLDPQMQFALERGEPSPRHRVIDNLPGTRAFCPLTRRTPEVTALSERQFGSLARDVVGRVRPDLMARAAAFILLNDSRSSFAIEGEAPSGERTARWGQAIAQAGSRRLSLEELNRLQRVVIGDARFVRLGLRTEGGFVGVHDRHTNQPIPDHISARHEDLADLIAGLVAYAQRASQGGLDPVVAAAGLAFGFVYIHPYVDGNGRLHRWLIHHALATAGFNPPGVVFPISAAILREIDAYRRVLESYSAPLLPLIEWRPTEGGNIEVLNQTVDYYRYFDATEHTRFLYACVEQTLDRDLPQEVRFLEAFDAFSVEIQKIIDMPIGQIELLQRFLDQNSGQLSRRARDREFSAFTDAEAERVERAYARTFGEENVD